MEINHFRRHVVEIARTHRVVVVFDKLLAADDGVAVSEARMIVVHPVFEETTYMVAMHELGHVLAPGGHGTIDKSLPPLQQIISLMDQEDAAWEWARANAIMWTELMEHWAQWARESYRTSVVAACKAKYIRTPGRPISEWR